MKSYPAGPQDMFEALTHAGSMEVPVYYAAFRFEGRAFFETSPGEWHSAPAEGIGLRENEDGTPLVFCDLEGSDTPSLSEFLSEPRNPNVSKLF